MAAVAQVTAEKARASIIAKYKTILGRNKYSQAKRTYVNTRYKDGNYYSDCSSSVCWAYREAGYPITYGGSTLPSTVGIYLSKDMADVPVRINSKGEIENPEVLRVGDCLLFAGNDSSRSYAGYVGHVEMVGEISGSKVYLYGHGSGTPRRTEMQAYLRSRRTQKSGTKLGHRGLIRVRRLIPDDGASNCPETPNGSVGLQLGDRILRNGMEGADVRELQTQLIKLGYSCGSYGCDGEYGEATELAVRAYQRDHDLDVDGEAGPKTIASIRAEINAVASPAMHVRIYGGDCYVRQTPDKVSGAIIDVAHEGELYPYLGTTSSDGWHKIDYKSCPGWVSGKYGRVV